MTTSLHVILYLPRLHFTTFKSIQTSKMEVDVEHSLNISNYFLSFSYW